MSRNPTRGRGRGDDRGNFSLPQGRGRYSSHSRGPHPDRPDQRGRGAPGRSRGDGGGFGRGRGAPTEVFDHQDGHAAKPDVNVMRIENESAAAAKLTSTKSAPTKPAAHPRLPLRPGFGTRGKEVLLWTNYFVLLSKGDLVLFRYSIEILPKAGQNAPPGKKVRRIVQLLLEDHLAQNGRKIVTDFKSTLISRDELQINKDGYLVQYRGEDEDGPGPNAPTYRVRLQHTGTLTVSELTDYLTSTQAGALFGPKEEIIQALNIMVGHHPKVDTTIASVGANKHFRLNAAATERFDLGAGLLALRGFFVSVRAATARILVNVQVKHGAFYNDGPLEDLMLAFMQENGQSRALLGRFLERLSINVKHIVRKNKAGRIIPRIKTIIGLARSDDGVGQPNPPIVASLGAGPKDVQFFVGDFGGQSIGKSPGPSGPSGKKRKEPKNAGPNPSQGRYISVYDFFKQTYNITIRNPELPVVNVGSRQKPTYLPPQVCQVIPGQPSNAKLTPSQTKNMIKFAVRKPAQNARSVVTSGAQLLGFHPTNATLTAFDTSVTPKLLVIHGRVLTGPDVKYGGAKTANTRFGSWNMASVEFATKTTLDRWTYLMISSQACPDQWRDKHHLMEHLGSFAATLRQVGVNASNAVTGLRITVDMNNLKNEIDTAVNKLASHANPPKLLLVILPVNNADIYNQVKYACDVNNGLLNVCVIADKFARANEQYFANVALKINLKLGGRNQLLDQSKLGILSEGKTMVVGIDVTHPSPGSSPNAPSVAGIVASVDRTLAQWPAALQIQTARQEMVSNLDTLFKTRLQLWKAHNGSYPANILVYRDGVSEGQYDQVLDKELPALRSACKSVYPATSTKQGIPRFTVVIVGKRHNTRFYPTKAQDADRSSNPQNGTVVDRGVTEARNWDFFLQAHTAIQGTARPAHYYVVYDEIFRSENVKQPFQNAADVLEDLTHNLCYLFGRATKAVSICPPAYYADLVCERARCYLSGVFDPSSAAGPVASSAGGAATSAQSIDSSLVRIHERVRDTMFYI